MGDGVLTGVEDEAAWRRQVLNYLWQHEGIRDQSASMSTCTASLGGVSLTDINKDLRLLRKGEAASLRKLRCFRSALALSRARGGQTFVALRWDTAVVPVSTAS